MGQAGHGHLHSTGWHLNLMTKNPDISPIPKTSEIPLNYWVVQAFPDRSPVAHCFSWMPRLFRFYDSVILLDILVYILTRWNTSVNTFRKTTSTRSSNPFNTTSSKISNKTSSQTSSKNPARQPGRHPAGNPAVYLDKPPTYRNPRETSSFGQYWKVSILKFLSSNL